ncbi:MAG: ABC transporter permease [Synergistaceae bacterium]|jgi:peptide/nickel transport system permease protein|nr:ABC transporter permease [Synergistaceae bacterium]
MHELNYIIKRVGHMIPVLLCITILVFFMIRLIPGNAAEILLGDRFTPEKLAILERKMGLDKPIIVQYAIYMKQVMTLDFGDSIKYVRPVIELLRPKIAVTASLIATMTLFVIVFSFPIGYYAGENDGSAADRAISVANLLVLALPQFFVGTILLLFFSLKLKWFPVGNWGETTLQHLHALILPGITGGLSTCALMIRNLRNNVIDVIRSDYVDFAHTKGLSDKTIKSRHVLRNAMISTVTLLSLRIVNMLGISIVIETVFSLPGLGKLLVDSIFARDYAVVQAAVLLIAFMVLLVNLLTDIAYSLIDPRVRLE